MDFILPSLILVQEFTQTSIVRVVMVVISYAHCFVLMKEVHFDSPTCGLGHAMTLRKRGMGFNKTNDKSNTFFWRFQKMVHYVGRFQHAMTS